MVITLNEKQNKLLNDLLNALKQKSSKITVKYLRKSEEDIHVIGQYLKQNNRIEELRMLQDFTNNLFSAKKMEKKTPDFYKKINANWMANLSDEAKQKGLSSLVLPGTHDSGAYKIDYSHTPKGKWWWAGFGARIGKLIGVSKFIKNWTLTQDYDLYKQLEQGVRSLDLRITYNNSEKKFYISHSFACIPLDNALQDIKRFMQEHPQEILLIQMSPDYEHRQGITPEVGDKLLAQCQETLGDLLAKRPSNDPDPAKQTKEFSDLTLQKMISSNSRILLSNSCAFSPTSLHAQSSWTKNIVQGQWLNVTAKDKAMSKIDSTLKSRLEDKKAPSQLREIGFTLTPDGDMIKKSVKRHFIPFGRYIFRKNRDNPDDSLRTLGQAMNKEVGTVLNKYKERAQNENIEIPRLGNIIPLDHIECSDAVDEIVNLNFKKN
ncbi:MAG: hypothetical protein HYX61_12240 [Gammaproteobacteria bacterium]|jgi:hypothetical protein|nr:hypothetical protein [Gammaproteobacteria bacterium]